MKSSVLLWLLGLLLHTAGQAQTFATVEAVSGKVTITSESGAVTAATVGHKLMRGDSVVTQGDSELHAQTQDGGFVALRPHTAFKVEQYDADPNSVGAMTLSLLKGTLRSITGWIGKKNPASYRIVTSTATIGIRGTDHETTVLDHDLDHDRAGTYDFVHEGATVIRTERGELAVERGQHGFSPRDGALREQLLERMPHFFENRKLRLEDRIKARKELLSARIQQILEDRRANDDAVGDRLDDATDTQREAARQALRRKMLQRRAH